VWKAYPLVVTRRQLTDEQWKLIEPFLPIGEYGPYPHQQPVAAGDAA
jgi:transposase